MEILYSLPFDHQRYGVHIIQGRNGPWSHFRLSEFLDLSNAVDFALPLGAEAWAARRGEIIGVYDDSDSYYVGTDSKANKSLTNFVEVVHQDRTRASYLHLRRGGVVVRKGQIVEEGSLIAYTGLSGWLGWTKLVPHLHFQVNQPAGEDIRSLPVIFKGYSGSLEHSQLFP